MAKPDSDDDELDAYERVVVQMSKRVRRINSAQELMTALRWGLEELDRAYAKAPAAARAAVACRAGCGACCHVPVDGQAHEVLYAAEHIRTHFSPEAIERTLGLLSAHRQHMESLAPGARETSRRPCALLVDGSCSIYTGRPQPCRAHHTSNAATCAEHLADPSVDIKKVYVPAIRARMFSVMLGVDEAIEAAGYDESAYDFGSALHEALTNPECLAAWLRHEPAFPDSCLADPVEQ